MLQTILLETAYFLFVFIPSIIIYQKTKRIYYFSKYKGLQYFSSAFLYLAIGFLMRFVVMLIRAFSNETGTISSLNIFTVIMEFFIVLPGLFLLYSLVWQRFEKKKYSFPYVGMLFIFVIALLVALADLLIQQFYVMYASQITIFFVAAGISLQKYLARKNVYAQLLFISMVLFLIMWIINAVAQYTINNVPVMRLYTYLFTVGGCFVLWFMTLRVTRDV